MKHRAAPPLALMALSLCGCLSVPLGHPEAKAMDTRLLGKWRCSSAQAGSSETAGLEVVRFDDSQYYADWREGDRVARYRAYPSKIGPVTVLNVEELNGRFTPWPWAIVRATVDDAGALTLEMVDGKQIQAKDENAAIREIKVRIGDRSIYQALAQCVEIRE